VSVVDRCSVSDVGPVFGVGFGVGRSVSMSVPALLLTIIPARTWTIMHRTNAGTSEWSNCVP